MWKGSKKGCDLTVVTLPLQDGLAEPFMRNRALQIWPSATTFLLEPLGILHINPRTRADMGGDCLPKDKFSLKDKNKHLTLWFVKVFWSDFSKLSMCE